MSDHLREDEVQILHEKVSALSATLNSVLFGQSELIDQVLICMCAGGHVLLEGLPGLGKTELVKSLGKAIDLAVKRVQFTPDILPGDVTGSPILEEYDGGRRFVFQEGPIFCNLLLADEINRASPKTQSALLEAMQERRVSVIGETHELPEPFFVLATQNPIELEGTYPLPEAQLDRFLCKLYVRVGDTSVLEQIIMNRDLGEEITIDSIMSKSDLLEIIQKAKRIYLPPVVINYIARLVQATHASSTATHIKHGASPRAAIGLAAVARARALIKGRINASFEDIQALAVPVLAHRIVLDYKTKVQGHSAIDIVNMLLEEIGTEEKVLPELLEHAS